MGHEVVWATFTLGRLMLQQQTEWCGAVIRLSVPCVDGSVLARTFFTSQVWSEQPCVRPIDAAHTTADHSALRGSGPGQKLYVRSLLSGRRTNAVSRTLWNCGHSFGTTSQAPLSERLRHPQP